MGAVSPPDRRTADDLADAALVRRIRAGDKGAVDDLYERFRRPAFALARRILADDVLAEDVLQDVFLSVWRDPSAFDRARGSFASWLLALVHHKAVDLVRREDTARRRTVPMDPQSGEAAKRPSPDDIEAAAMRAELRVALRDGLAELSEEDQALLRLNALAEPYKNVSELLQMKTGSIGPTLGRSLARLRQTRALRRYLGTQPAAETQEGGDQLELARMDR